MSSDLARLARLLDASLDLDPAQQAAFLDALPDADQPLRGRLHQMLEEHRRSDAPDHGDASPDPADPAILLDQLPALAASAAQHRLRQAAGDGAQRHVGPYRLVRLLGEGGMGSVWLAERDDGTWHRSVALKLPHPGLDQGRLGLRFERERDILAALEHPHIARLYDTGVDDDGRPWLALEYVEGLPISVYCDRAALSVRQRVELFLQVLQAVQYAHARLVVHRDLKPSNIFVNAAGQVSLLDFGIATLLEADDTPSHQRATEWSTAPMTPDYASPEQIARQRIGTASDIYSLGVVFFELVTGQRPYRLARDTRGALEEAILATQPTRPSRMVSTDSAALQRATALPSLRRQLRGDIDNIALKALRKQPAERFPSAEAFEQDLRRWLRHEPVHAHPVSLMYLTGKFVQRHTWPVAAALLTSAGLIGGITVALVQVQVAEREVRRTQAVQAFLVGLFNEADPARAQGRELTVRDLMARGERDLATRLGSEPDLKAALSQVLVGLYSRLGDDKRALPLAEATRALMNGEHGSLSLEHGDALMQLARIQSQLGHHEDSLKTLAQARTAFETWPSQSQDRLLTLALMRADNLESLTRSVQARDEVRAVLPRLIERHGPLSWQVIKARVQLASSLSTLGELEAAAGELNDLGPALLQQRPEHGLEVATLRADIGFIQWRSRQWKEAAASLTAAIREMDALVGPRNAPAIPATRTLGMVYLESGQYEKAGEILAENVRRSVAFYGQDDSETALNLSFQVMALARLGRLAESESVARQSVQVARQQGTLSAGELRGIQRRLGSTLLLAGRTAEALALLDRLAEEEVAAGQLDARHGATLNFRAGALNAAGRPREAVDVARASQQAWLAAGDGAGNRVGLGKARLTEALAWLALHRAGEAGSLIEQATADLAVGHAGREHPDRVLPDRVRARWLRDQGKPAQAEALEQAAQERYRRLSGGELPPRLDFIY